MAKPKIKYNINGDEWVLSILSKKDFQKKHGKKALAITETEEAYIDFRKDAFSIEVVRHELLHAHFVYCFLESADLKAGQMEEVACDLYAYRGKLIDKQAKEVYAKLKRKK